MVKLALETAMRQGELFSLRWENIDLAKSALRLPETKNGEARTVPLSRNAKCILENMDCHDGVVKLRRGKVFNANIAATRIAFTRAVERARTRYLAACQRINHTPDPQFLNDLVFHDLRHEAVSRLFELGTLSMMEVASISGHKSLSMLKRYTHLHAHKLAEKLG